jgi:hypothetical protein
MTQEDFDKAPLLDQILYDTTGMLVENHKDIAEAMEKYHQAKLKLLGIADVSVNEVPFNMQDLMLYYGKSEFVFNSPISEVVIGMLNER